MHGMEGGSRRGKERPWRDSKQKIKDGFAVASLYPGGQGWAYPTGAWAAGSGEQGGHRRGGLGYLPRLAHLALRRWLGGLARPGRKHARHQQQLPLDTKLEGAAVGQSRHHVLEMVPGLGGGRGGGQKVAW
jgi:hypothetical protein